MADIQLTQDEFKRLSALAEQGKAVQAHLQRLTTLARRISPYDLQEPVLTDFYAAVNAAQDIEAREVKAANPTRTQAAPKRRS